MPIASTEGVTLSMTSKVAVVQASPVVFDRERTIDKLSALTHAAAKQDAQLVVFPEAFISAYPRGLDFGAVVGSRTDAGREDFRRYWESSVDVPGPAFDHLSRTARSNNIYLVVGVMERELELAIGVDLVAVTRALDGGDPHLQRLPRSIDGPIRRQKKRQRRYQNRRPFARST